MIAVEFRGPDRHEVCCGQSFNRLATYGLADAATVLTLSSTLNLGIGYESTGC